jgi:DNA-binding transcriptional ArsR family regulator
MMQKLNYNHLYYFWVIANEGNLVKAARILLVSQSALSTQLKKLEHHLDTELFDREGRALKLTEAGQVTLEYANKIFSLGNELTSVLRDNKKIDIAYALKQKHEIVRTEKGKEPRYLIYGGFIFSPLTYNYLLLINSSNSNFELYFLENAKTKHFKEAVMMLYETLPHEINTGYHSHGDIVKSVNGILVEDFEHFVKLIDSVVTPYTVIEFIDEDFKKIILDTQKAKESFQDIKAIYGLSRDRNL